MDVMFIRLVIFVSIQKNEKRIRKTNQKKDRENLPEKVQMRTKKKVRNEKHEKKTKYNKQIELQQLNHKQFMGLLVVDDSKKKTTMLTTFNYLH